ncbi:hypothetical protein BGZ74_010848 [Mortierella antarctica]|nr:hypothetical protein BGZ74_010848 [Mortierella antarctica]
MSNYDPPHHPSSSPPSSPSSSVTDTLMRYLTSAMSKSQEVIEHAKGFGHSVPEQLSYVAAQTQIQAQRATNDVSGTIFFLSGQRSLRIRTNYGDWSRSRSFSGLPQYRSQVDSNNSQLFIGSNGYNNGGNYNNPIGQTSHHSQEIGSGDPAEKRRWSRGNTVSYSSHHYTAAHSSFKSSQGGL